MAITPAQLPAYLMAIRARVEAAAVPVAQAIGSAYKEHLVGVTLHESGSHPPMARGDATYPAAGAPGRPPAFMPGGLHGSLAGSVEQVPAFPVGAGMAETIVAPHAIYSATVHWGAVHTGRMWLWVGYIGAADVRRRGWIKRKVEIKSHPYMIIAIDETITNGALSRAGISAFTVAVWG